MLSKRGVSMVLEFQHLLENTPPWTGLHQSSPPNAAKGYPPREPRENTCYSTLQADKSFRGHFPWCISLAQLATLAGTPTAEHLAPRQYDFKVKMEVD